MPEQQERPGHLDPAEQQHPADLREGRAQRLRPYREGQQQNGTDQRAPGDHRRRRVRLDRDADEQIRDAPQQRHRAEQQPRTRVEPLDGIHPVPFLAIEPECTGRRLGARIANDTLRPISDTASGRPAQTERRPSKARPRVTSSAYSRSPPTGSPEARRVTVTPTSRSRRERYVAVASPSRFGSVAMMTSCTSPDASRGMSSRTRRSSGPMPSIGLIAPPSTW